MIIRDRTAPTAAERDCPTLFVAIELSRSSCLVAVHTPPIDKIGMHRLAAGDVEGLLAPIARQRAPAVSWWCCVMSAIRGIAGITGRHMSLLLVATRRVRQDKLAKDRR